MMKRLFFTSCEAIIQACFDKDVQKWFGQPIHPENDGIPHYRTIIKEPMDFGLILKRCQMRSHPPHYRSLEQWMGDAARVTDNARRYNTPETEYFVCANKVDAFLTGRLRGLLGIGAGARA